MSDLDDAEIRRVVSSLKTEYGARPPLEIIAGKLGVPTERARSIWARFTRSTAEAPQEEAILEPMDDLPGTSAKLVSLSGDPLPGKPGKAPAKKAAKKKAKPSVVHAVADATKNLEKVADHLHEPPVGLIRIMAFLVAIVLIFRPIGYAHDYFARSNEDWMAWAMALGLGGAAFVAPQIAILGFRNRSLWTVAAGALLIVMSFWASIQVTLAELTYLRNQSQSSFVQAEAVADTVATQREDWQRSYDTAKEARDNAQKKVDLIIEQGKLTLIGTPEYWQYKADLKVAEKPRDVAQGNMDEADSALRKLPADVNEKVAGKADQRSLEIGYQTDAAFAITQDVVGPLMLAMAVFLRKKIGVKVWFTRKKK